MSVLEEEFSRLGLSISRESIEKLEAYARAVEHWNRAVNLTSLEGVQLIRRLIVEPSWFGEQLQMSGNVFDVGSGNGCPGVPLYVCRGLDRLDLVEARTRRAAFLRHIAKELGLAGIVVHKVRLENIKEPPAGTDWITLQGVDLSPAIIQVLKSFFAPTTRVVWITSRSVGAPQNASRICAPRSNTVAWFSKLDQF